MCYTLLLGGQGCGALLNVAEFHSDLVARLSPIMSFHLAVIKLVLSMRLSSATTFLFFESNMNCDGKLYIVCRDCFGAHGYSTCSNMFPFIATVLLPVQEGMFKDIEGSEALMSQFQLQLQRGVGSSSSSASPDKPAATATASFSMDLHVHVLTSAYWPAYSPVVLPLPPEVSSGSVRNAQ